MESLEDSNNCTSMSDSFSLYERYMKSFNVRENYYDPDSASATSISRESSNGGTIDLSIVVPQHGIATDGVCDSQIYNIEKYGDSKDKSLFLVASVTSSHTDRSDLADARISDESCGGKPVFISSIMENSNNAVDSVPLFKVKNENVFKLPITELTFNGTLKHVQKLKPIVDPISALSTCMNYEISSQSSHSVLPHSEEKKDIADFLHQDKEPKDSDVDSSSKWNDQSVSSLEASFDSGVRSPDMFSEGDDSELESEPKRFWTFLQDVDLYDKKKVKQIQETLQGILPPPSVTTLKTDVTDMLQKYYTHLPQFNPTNTLNINNNSMTPTKKFSFIQIPEICNGLRESTQNIPQDMAIGICSMKCQDASTAAKVEVVPSSNISSESNSNSHDQSVDLKLSSETEVKQSVWPDVLKCRHHDVYYNLSAHREQYETLLQRYAERFIGAETASSVSVLSGGAQSPTSASKRKALRLKLAQAKSPGRRLSHLARRRQAFCSAATIGEKAHTSSKMVLIDKNYFPHRKLINSADRLPKSRRTPGKRTPRKTPAKTPKSGGSSKKKAMRRLLMDDELSKSQPSREALKRALFVSPEAGKGTCHSAKSRRSLFGSPSRPTETKSMDGTSSDLLLKRKREDDDGDSKRVKLAKSFSFGGDASEYAQSPGPFRRRASEMLSSQNSAELNDLHKKKLLWAVSEALRAQGWRMSSPGFREKASLLARLTRRLIALPPHARRLAAPALSTSDTLLRLARRYAFAVLRGRSVDDCFRDEEARLADEAGGAAAPRREPASRVKENGERVEREPRSASGNVLRDKLLNVDSDSSGASLFDKLACRPSSAASSEEAARARARRQISFDEADFAR